MAQFLRPNADIDDGLWTAFTGSDLYAMIDESSASDADYIQILGSHGVTAGYNCQIGLSSAGDPVIHTGHILRMRAKKSASGGDSLNLTYNLINDTSGSPAVIDDETFALTDAWQTFEYTIPTTAADDITDYADLSIYLFSIDGVVDRNYQVSWVELEIPDAGSGSAIIPILMQVL